jgi:hypothetical protein
MPPLIRWQWLWKSRLHLAVFGLGLIALGGLLLAFALLVVRPRPLHRNFYLFVVVAVGLIGYGGYQILQALLSPAGAFGDHHDEPTTRRRRRWQRPLVERPTKPDDGPIPLADD